MPQRRIRRSAALGHACAGCRVCSQAIPACIEPERHRIECIERDVLRGFGVGGVSTFFFTFAASTSALRAWIPAFARMTNQRDNRSLAHQADRTTRAIRTTP